MNTPTLLLLLTAHAAIAGPLTKTVLYVTQTPIPDEGLSPVHFLNQTKINITTTMQSPLADTLHAPRGGALMIRYSDGSPPRNLTAAAGYGGTMDANANYTGAQRANGLAVQRPFLHWSGTKALFSMVAGGPVSGTDTTQFRWQLYEITSFGKTQTPVISYVQGQPAAYNNMQGCYDTQDRIIFVSDAPRGMVTHLYPQLDEYLSLPCNTGLWRLDRAHGNELKHLIHCASGGFTPFVDSAGRVMFVQWDHQSRDVFATYDRPPITANGDAWTQTFNGNGTFASEAANAAFAPGTAANYVANNNYPEPRNFDKTAQLGSNLNPNTFNQFFPWECREDGSGHEIQNHVGRHELGGTTGRALFNDDPNLVLLSFTHPVALNFLHLTESFVTPGTFYAVSPPEIGTHSAGPIVRYNGGVTVNPDTMQVTYVTPQTTFGDVYRNPVPLSDGNLLAVHANVSQVDSNIGTNSQNPRSRYAFRLRMLIPSSVSGVTTLVPDTVNNPTVPANVTLNYFEGSTLITYSGAPLWELDPVEVVARSVPAQLVSSVPAVEQTVFDEEGVHAPTYQNYLRTNNLALAVSRNSTRRDAADKQQPFNLKVAWSALQSIGTAGKIYDIGWIQLLQADALRGYTFDGANAAAPVQPGRRILPVPLHDTVNEMPSTPGAPPGGVKLGNDGSWAAVVPAGRAISWHLLDGAAVKSQVRERYWVTFSPGEVRTCAACHGVNTNDQTGFAGAPQNKPEALRPLLQFWKSAHPPGVVQHAAPAVSVLKNAGTLQINVTRTGGSTGPAQVDYQSVAGTAAPGTDFTIVPGTLTWADADTAPKPISIQLLNPATITGSRTFTVTLTNPKYASAGAVTSAAITIAEPPFQAWLFQKFGAAANTAASGPQGDPDNDGITNLFEYLLGADPQVPDQALLPVFASDSSGLSLTWDRRTGLPEQSGITIFAEWSTDLAGPWSTTGVTESLLSATGGMGHYRATIPGSGKARLFARLHALLQ